MRALELYKNELSSIPESFGDLASLEAIGLSNNNIKTIPSQLKNLTLITEIGIKFNPLDKFPQFFKKYPVLKIVAVDDEQNIQFDDNLRELCQKGVDVIEFKRDGKSFWRCYPSSWLTPY